MMGNEKPEGLDALCDLYEQTTGDRPKSAGIYQVQLAERRKIAAFVAAHSRHADPVDIAAAIEQGQHLTPVSVPPTPHDWS